MKKLEQIDLFENLNVLPPEVLAIYVEFSDELTYEKCACLLKRMKDVGYTFEYYLDAIPFNLKKYNKMNKIRYYINSLGEVPDNLLPTRKNNLEVNLNRDSKGFNLHLFDGNFYLFSIIASDIESIQSYINVNNLTITNNYIKKLSKK